jgi:hypothetical protein
MKGCSTVCWLVVALVYSGVVQRIRNSGNTPLEAIAHFEELRRRTAE